jgi:phenylalanyl-tRNA synthetase beta chain
MIAELGGGKVVKGIMDVCPKPIEEKVISLRLKRVNSLLGLNLSGREVVDLLQRASFEITTAGPDTFLVRIPTHRFDLTREVDIIEEIACLNGYEKVPETLPRTTVIKEAEEHHEFIKWFLIDRIRRTLKGQGFNEVINYSFYSQADLDKLLLPPSDSRRRVLPILNPLTEEQSVLRTTVMPSLLKNLSSNERNKPSAVRLFELRHVYFSTSSDEPPVQLRNLGLVMSGARYQTEWCHSEEHTDYFDMKGVLEAIFHECRIKNVSFRDSTQPFLIANNSCEIFLGEQAIGFFGAVHPDVLRNFDISEPAYILELEVDRLKDNCERKIRFQPLPRFPGVTRDIALVIDENISSEAISSQIKQFPSKIIEDVSVFDVFRGGNVPEGKKSMAYSIRYLSRERTLTDEEVNKVHDGIIKHLKNKLGAEIRQ